MRPPLTFAEKTGRGFSVGELLLVIATLLIDPSYPNIAVSLVHKPA